MNAKKELKRVLIAGVAALTLMTGCGKNDTKESDRSYYMLVDNEYVEIENVKSVKQGATWQSSKAYITFNDGSTMQIPLSNLYVMDKTSEEQNKLVKKLTK